MTDPYKILGVSRDASDDDIKTAYRNLAKKYHPDNFADDEVARTMAEEKMKDINEAYDAIQNQRKNGYSSNNGSAGSSPSFNTVRAYINAGNLAEAEAMLNRIDEYDRGAEWHFLKGCVAASRGQYFDAQNYISKSCQMDPGNMEYRNALNQFAGGARAYNGGYRTTQAQGCSGSDMCTTLLCADCCCECMGGDLIRCC